MTPARVPDGVPQRAVVAGYEPSAEAVALGEQPGERGGRALLVSRA